MLDERRRHILKQMDVDVWVLRVAPGATPAASAEVSPEASPEAARAGPAALRAALEAPASPGPVARAAEPRRRPATEATGTAPAAGPAVAAATSPAVSAAPGDAADQGAFSVVSVALPGVVLLLEGDASRRDMRLARDLVSAVAGEWARKPERRRFLWPPTSGVVPASGGASDPARAETAPSRALRAFADKHLEDHKARLLICAGSVGDRIPDHWEGVRVLRISALSELSRDAAAKRRLWSELSAVP